MPTSNDWDDDLRIGVPTAGRTAAPPAPPDRGEREPPARPDPSVELREGETELGRPPQVPSGLALLSDEDRATLRRLEEEQAAKDLAEAELLLASDPSGLGWLGWFGSPLAFAFLVGTAGLAGLFVFNQVLSVLHALAAQPAWAQYAGYGGLALLGGCVLYAALRLAYLYLTLRHNRQLRLRGL